jgi:CSLREA domain-containing protein
MKTLRLLLLVFALDLSAATITVTGTGDAIAVDGACTLREAVTAANTNAASGDCSAGTAGLDQIHFAIGGGGAQSIVLFNPLPDIVDPVTIDATTQPGYAGTPLIEVFTSYIDNVSMFVVQMAGGGSTFRGLILRGSISGGASIELRSSGNVVAGNYFGTNGTTFSDFGGVGVFILGTVGAPASNNVIGGVAAADRNLFSGSAATGVAVNAAIGAIADANSILGNDFGWNAAKTAGLGGLNDAISIGRATNTIIRGNSMVNGLAIGISIVLASGTVVQSNQIGAIGAVFGYHVAGIRIDSATGTIIGAATSGGPGGNVIIGNGTLHPEGAAVLIFNANSSGNRISGNSMSFNGLPPGIGIDLFPYGATPNDACDPDAGPNQLQNKPVLTSAVAVNGTIIVDGSLNSTASASYTIELYANPPGTGDQGYQYIGAVGVTTDAGCNATFTSTVAFVPPADGWTITATAIDGANNTSEMSAPATIVELDAPAVSKQFNPTTVTAGSATQLTITLTNPNALAIIGTAFTDNYPAGLQNALIPNVTNSCGGIVAASPGGSTLMLTGGSIPANGSCSVTVSVVPANEGSFVNTLPAGAVTSANAPPSAAAASATLTASAAPAAAADVPMSPAALMLLAIALSTIGAIALRQISSGS